MTLRLPYCGGVVKFSFVQPFTLLLIAVSLFLSVSQPTLIPTFLPTTNVGYKWTEITSIPNNPSIISTSGTGQYVAAVAKVLPDPEVYVSSNFGVNWTLIVSGSYSFNSLLTSLFQALVSTWLCAPPMVM